jgi:hypothetical protein
MDEMKKIVFTWGRMNPITTGHEVLAKKVMAVARSLSADAAIYLTHSHDAKKNPLSYDDKIKLAQHAFGPVVKKAPYTNIIAVMKDLQNHYDDITLVVGSDRVPEFKKFLDKYNGIEYKVAHLSVVSAGERDPDADDVTGMSASKMRALATAEDLSAFKSGLPSKLRSSAADVMAKVRKGMMMEELEEGLTYSQRKRRAAVMRKYSAKIKHAREKAMNRSSTNKTFKKRARKAAVDRMERRLASGRDPSTLSSGEKSRIEDIVKKRKKSIVRMTNRMLPLIRKREKTRMAARQSVREAAMAGEMDGPKKNEKKSTGKNKSGKKYIELFNADSMKEEYKEFLLVHGLVSDDDLLEFDVSRMVDEIIEKRGLWDNIHAKRERIKRGSGERMRKPGSKGAPTDANIKSAQEGYMHIGPADGKSPYDKFGDKRKGTTTLGNDSKREKRDREAPSTHKTTKHINDRLSVKEEKKPSWDKVSSILKKKNVMTGKMNNQVSYE